MMVSLVLLLIDGFRAAFLVVPDITFFHSIIFYVTAWGSPLVLSYVMAQVIVLREREISVDRVPFNNVMSRKLPKCIGRDRLAGETY